MQREPRGSAGHGSAHAGVDLEGFLKECEHAQAQQIDLDQAELLQIVFVPLDDGAVAHRRPLDRGDAHERVAREHHAARMDAHVAREAVDLLAVVVETPFGRFGRLALVRDAGRAGQRFARVELARQPLGFFQRKADRFCHVAQRRSHAIGNDLGRHGRVGAPVALVHVLNDLFAVAMREVDVDVGNLLPFLGHETFEKQAHPDRIHGRDAERVTDRRIGRRSPALAEHVELARRAHDVPDD